MTKVIKWILGIFLSLVILAGLAAVAYLVFYGPGWAGWQADSRAIGPWEGRPSMPWHNMPWHTMPWHPFGRMPMQRFGGFFPLQMILSGLFWLALLALVVFGLVALFTRQRYSTQPGAPVAPMAVQRPAPIQEPTRACPNCHRPMQADWSNCPYDGSVL